MTHPSSENNPRPEIVNIVGSGELNQSLDLLSVYSAIGPPLAKYDPEMYHGMYLFNDEENSLTATIYTSGSYIIVGAKTIDELSKTNQRILNILSNTQKIDDLTSLRFDVSNIVMSGDVGMELELNQIAIDLGLDNVEYDPENFPGVVYTDKKNDCTMLIFRTGQITVTGATSIDSMRRAYTDFAAMLPNSD